MIYMSDEKRSFIDSLNVGDRVAVKKYKPFGWNLQVVFYDYVTISRITPKRTKFTFERGGSLERDEIRRMCPITEGTDRENEVCRKRVELNKAISEVTNNNPDGRYRLSATDIPDERMDDILKLLLDLSDALRIPRDGDSH